MGLTKDDATIIRDIVFEGIDTLTPRFEALEEGQARIEYRLDKVEHRLDDVEKRLDGMGNNLQDIKQQLTILEHRMSNLEKRFDTLEGKLEALSADISELYVMIEQHPEITTKEDFRDYAQSIITTAHAKLKALAKEADIPFPEA